EKTPSFTVNDAKGFYHCFGCGAHGDIFRFLGDHENMRFADAVQLLASQGGVTLTDAPATSRTMLESKKEATGESIYVPSDVVGEWAWRTASPALRELPESWLRYREIDPSIPLVQRALRRAKFHPAMPLYPWRRYEREGSGNLIYPAMLLPVEQVSGPFGARKRRMIGVHATYLRPDGRGKAVMPQRKDKTRPPARKVWGSVTGGAVWLSGIDGLDGPVGSAHERAPIVIGEGFESTLDAMLLQPGETRGAAALNLNNLQGSLKTGPSGQVRLFNIEPSSPGFVFDDPGAVIVAIDADMKPLKNRKVQEARGAPIAKRDVTGSERSDICAALAVKNWRRAGADLVEAIRPPSGMDFNDFGHAAQG
ncbi:MAG: CHC2 zinc finger domain-containing protein, partial [Pseudomonadota bacterium]